MKGNADQPEPGKVNSRRAELQTLARTNAFVYALFATERNGLAYESALEATVLALAAAYDESTATITRMVERGTFSLLPPRCDHKEQTP